MSFETVRVGPVDGPLLVRSPVHEDERGSFFETFSERFTAALGSDVRFVQGNQSRSKNAGTVRGLHFQRAPHVQAKLVRVLAGAVYDVALDLRRGSPTYRQSVAARLDEPGHQSMWIPAGFAHGFQTLADETVVEYLVTSSYAPQAEAGIRHDDPALDIPWPMPVRGLSAKDRAAPAFSPDEHWL